jgi:hypothetical protein
MTFDEMVEHIDKIEKLLKKGNFGIGYIDAYLEELADTHDDQDGVSNEEYIIALRATFMFREKLSNWNAARDRARDILTERNLDADKILRGLE